jgi:intracellular septation protein
MPGDPPMPGQASDPAPADTMATPVDGAPIAMPAKEESWLPLALDFGPLLIFFVAFKALGMIAGTAAFMATIAIAVLLSKVKLGKVSPMLWLSAVLVLFFGSLTIYFHDERFIQIKPTIIYSFFAVMLLVGWVRGRPLLKYLLGAAYKGLSEQGWLNLSRNWGIFFLAMAIANEAMRATLSFDTWLSVKVWGVTIVSLLFAMANVPMLLRHGLDLGAEKSA